MNKLFHSLSVTKNSDINRRIQHHLVSSNIAFYNFGGRKIRKKKDNASVCMESYLDLHVKDRHHPPNLRRPTQTHGGWKGGGGMDDNDGGLVNCRTRYLSPALTSWNCFKAAPTQLQSTLALRASASLLRTPR